MYFKLNLTDLNDCFSSLTFTGGGHYLLKKTNSSLVKPIYFISVIICIFSKFNIFTLTHLLSFKHIFY